MVVDSGCSLAFVKRPPASSFQTPVECTSSVAAPVVDTGLTAFGTYIGVVGVKAALDTPSCASNPGNPLGPGMTRVCNMLSIEAIAIAITVAAVGAALAGATGASAYYGYTHTSACRKMRARVRVSEPFSNSITGGN
jgi:hypothetical protein